MANEVDHVGGAAHRLLGVFIHDHANQHIAGEHLFFGALTGAVFFDLDRWGLGDLNLQDPIGDPKGYRPLLEGGFDLLLATRRHLDGIPASNLRFAFGLIFAGCS